MSNLENRPDTMEHHHARRSNWAWWVFAIVALFYLITEHQAHLMGALPYLLLLACPLMHLFMHHGHGHGHRKQSGEDDK